MRTKITKDKLASIKRNSRNGVPEMRTFTKVKESKKIYNRRKENGYFQKEAV